RGGAVGRSDRAGDEARAIVLSLREVGRRAREPRALEIELIGDVLHAVVGLRDRGRGESVGRDNVGAGAIVGEMNVPDRVGLGEGWRQIQNSEPPLSPPLPHKGGGSRPCLWHRRAPILEVAAPTDGTPHKPDRRGSWYRNGNR